MGGTWQVERYCLAVKKGPNKIDLPFVPNLTTHRNMLGPSVPFFTIVREPSAAFESIYSYYNFESLTHLSFGEYIERL